MARALAVAEAESRSRRAATARDKRARLRAIAAVHERAVEEALSEGATKIHGEFYQSNVLVDQRGTSCSIHPVDWEMAGAGPPLLDLAALTKKVCRLEALSATPIESLSNDLGGLGADGLPIVPLA